MLITQTKERLRIMRSSAYLLPKICRLNKPRFLAVYSLPPISSTAKPPPPLPNPPKPRLRHPHLLPIHIEHQIRRPKKRIPEQHNGPLRRNNAQIAQVPPILIEHARRIPRRRTLKREDQPRQRHADAGPIGTPEVEGIAHRRISEERTGHVRRVGMHRGVHSCSHGAVQRGGQIHARRARIENHRDGEIRRRQQRALRASRTPRNSRHFHRPRGERPAEQLHGDAVQVAAVFRAVGSAEEDGSAGYGRRVQGDAEEAPGDVLLREELVVHGWEAGVRPCGADERFA